MNSIAIRTTAEQLAAIPDDGHPYELVDGELRAMSPAGHEHGHFAFVTKQRMNEVGPVQGFWPGAPDLLAEIVSSGDSFSDVEQKTLA